MNIRKVVLAAVAALFLAGCSGTGGDVLGSVFGGAPSGGTSGDQGAQQSQPQGPGGQAQTFGETVYCDTGRCTMDKWTGGER